jgi:hypothetical protein
LAYQPPANSTFLSEQTSTSNQPVVLFSQTKPAPAISHQPNEQAAVGCGPNPTEHMLGRQFLNSMVVSEVGSY